MYLKSSLYHPDTHNLQVKSFSMLELSMSYEFEAENESQTKLVSDFLGFSMKHYSLKITTFALPSVLLKKKLIRSSMRLKLINLYY